MFTNHPRRPPSDRLGTTQNSHTQQTPPIIPNIRHGQSDNAKIKSTPPSTKEAMTDNPNKNTWINDIWENASSEEKAKISQSISNMVSLTPKVDPALIQQIVDTTHITNQFAKVSTKAISDSILSAAGLLDFTIPYSPMREIQRSIKAITSIATTVDLALANNSRHIQQIVRSFSVPSFASTPGFNQAMDGIRRSIMTAQTLNIRSAQGLSEIIEAQREVQEYESELQDDPEQKASLARYVAATWGIDFKDAARASAGTLVYSIVVLIILATSDSWGDFATELSVPVLTAFAASLFKTDPHEDK